MAKSPLAKASHGDREQESAYNTRPLPIRVIVEQNAANRIDGKLLTMDYRRKFGQSLGWGCLGKGNEHTYRVSASCGNLP